MKNRNYRLTRRERLALAAAALRGVTSGLASWMLRELLDHMQ